MTKERANCRRSVERALAAGLSFEDIIEKTGSVSLKKQCKKMRGELKANALAKNDSGRMPL